MRMRVYLDMDGVLADFNAHMAWFGVEDNETHFIHKPREQWTPSQIDLDRRVRLVMERADFWPTIPVMPGAKLLWDFCCQHFEVYVLTATPNITETRERIARQKREWIRRELGPMPDERIVVCLRSEKKKYAKADAILVDDMPSNCDEWMKAGGAALLFKDAHDTIKHLTKLLGGSTLRPRNSAERKAEPIHSGVMMYFPDALAAIARHSKKANVKHNGPEAPLGWTRGKSNDHQDCEARHSLTPDEVDVETGEIEAVGRTWRSLADLQLREEKRLIAAGIKPYSGIIS